MLNFKQKLNKINTFIFDVDGVLTDGKVLVMESGEMVRQMNSKDSFALQLARKKDYNVVIMSSGNNIAVKNALKKTGVEMVYLNQQHKIECYKNFMDMHQLKDEEVLYMGDDLPDLEVMKKVGVAVCPNDSSPEIKNICIYVSPKNGGEGCVRDVIEQVMRLHGTWDISNLNIK